MIMIHMDDFTICEIQPYICPERRLAMAWRLAPRILTSNLLNDTLVLGTNVCIRRLR